MGHRLYPACRLSVDWCAEVHEVALQYPDPVNWLFLGGMLIAATMQQWGLHRRIALGIIFVIGASPRRIVL